MALAAAIAPVAVDVYIAALMQKGDMIDPRDLSPERPAFFALAACAGMDPSIFVPRRGMSVSEAKAVCAGCPVTAECLAYALADPGLEGVWGGTSSSKRVIMRRASPVVREPVACVVCGGPATRSAASHESSPKCQACWRVEYRRAYKLRHRVGA